MALLQTPEGAEVHIALQGATLEMFQGLTTRFLAAFVRVRVFDDVTAAWRVPSKGTVAATVNDGCKRTDGELLIKLAFDLRTLKPKAKLPNLPHAEPEGHISKVESVDRSGLPPIKGKPSTGTLRI
jgi:hypothetical protein